MKPIAPRVALVGLPLTFALLAIALLGACGNRGQVPAGADAGRKVGDTIIPATLSGDVTGPFTATAVGAIKGVSVPTVANGCLQASGGVLTWGSCGSGGVSISGTGLAHVTSSVIDGTAVHGTADQLLGANHAGTDTNFFTLAGDCTVVSGSITCSKVNGSSFPAGGALTTGNTLGVTGVSSLGFSSLNLAGGAAYVTGLLPLGNEASPTGTGFPHATSGSWDSASRAVNLNSADVTSTLPVGNGGTGDATLTAHATLLGEGTGAVASFGPCGSGVPMLGAGATADPTCSALNLAGGSSVVTGNLPVGNVAPGTSAQVLMSNATPATTWTSISQDVTLGATGAATVNGIKGTSIPSLSNGALTSTSGVLSWTTATASMFGTITTIAAGATTTLSQSALQSVLIAVNGSAATCKFPASPSDGDVIRVKTTGTSVSNQAVINPNGNNVEDPQNPGTTGSANVTTGPNPGVAAMWRYEASGTLWRLWQ